LPLASGRPPFNEADCTLVEALQPEVVSFHFGLPSAPLFERVKAAGCKVICSATSLAEARFLAARSVDAIIAKGAEAGGHHGMFLRTDVSTQTGMLALVRGISATVEIPVIAAGGIVDGPAIAACFALGASAVQIGTAYLLCSEALTPLMHRAAIADPEHETAITNVLTGRPARAVMNRFRREQGPMNEAAPSFPRAGPAIASLRKTAESEGRTDFSPFWSGQAAKLPPSMGPRELTEWLAKDALAALSQA